MPKIKISVVADVEIDLSDEDQRNELESDVSETLGDLLGDTTVSTMLA